MAHYELIVIGAGPGGYEAALHAAKLGKKVAVVEKREAGGTCLNRGCIPTKTLLHSSQIFHDAKHGAHAGIHTDDIRADMTEIFAYKREISQKLSSGIESLFKTAKIDFLRGTALITAPGAVRVTDAEGVRRAVEAGLHFVLSPVSDPDLAAAAGDVPFLGGALTPGEVAAATRGGAEVVAIAPADALGTAYARALPPLFPGVALVPWGRLERYQCEMWLAAGALAVVVGDVVLRNDWSGGANSPEEVGRRAGAFRPILGSS